MTKYSLNVMTGNFVQIEVSCFKGKLYVEKMTTDGHSLVLLGFQG